MSELIPLLARLTLGGVFLVAGVGKKLERDDGVARVVDYDLLPRRVARLYGAALPWLEMTVGLLLLIGPGLPSTSPARTLPLYLAAALLASFTIAVAITLARGREVECHCFGRFGGGVITPWILGRNLALLAFAVAAFFDGGAGWWVLLSGPAAVIRVPGMFLLLAPLTAMAVLAEAESLASASRRERRGKASAAGVRYWQPQ